jgi:hypothetical protein
MPTFHEFPLRFYEAVNKVIFGKWDEILMGPGWTWGPFQNSCDAKKEETASKDAQNFFFHAWVHEVIKLMPKIIITSVFLRGGGGLERQSNFFFLGITCILRW